jgi:hypothetical protein
MKKIVVVFLITIGFCACKKDRTCTCSYPDGTIASQGTYINVTKKEAKNFCKTTIQNVSCVVN